MRTQEEGPEGSPIVGAQIKSIKWPQSAIDALRAGQEPVGAEFTNEWSFGDIEAGFAEATAIIEEPFVTMGYPHHSLKQEPVWLTGKTGNAISTVLPRARVPITRVWPAC